MSEIDTLNRFGVATSGSGLTCILMPPGPGQLLDKAQALILAAYLVALADPELDEFKRILSAVMAS